MKTNMGILDRTLRLLAAVVLLWAAFGTTFAATGFLHWLFIGIAAIFALTGVVGNCPIYSAIGIRTCRDC